MPIKCCPSVISYSMAKKIVFLWVVFAFTILKIENIEYLKLRCTSFWKSCSCTLCDITVNTFCMLPNNNTFIVYTYSTAIKGISSTLIYNFPQWCSEKQMKFPPLPALNTHSKNGMDECWVHISHLPTGSQMDVSKWMSLCWLLPGIIWKKKKIKW